MHAPFTPDRRRRPVKDLYKHFELKLAEHVVSVGDNASLWVTDKPSGDFRNVVLANVNKFTVTVVTHKAMDRRRKGVKTMKDLMALMHNGHEMVAYHVVQKLS